MKHKFSILIIETQEKEHKAINKVINYKEVNFPPPIDKENTLKKKMMRYFHVQHMICMLIPKSLSHVQIYVP